MITINEQRTIREIDSNPDISLRELVKKLGLGGVASASYLINSLQTKGYLEKIGVTTNKKYILTRKARGLEEVLNMKIEDLNPKKMSSIVNTGSHTIATPSTGAMSDVVNKIDSFSRTDFPNSTGDSDAESFKTILSASFTKVIDSPNGLQKYGDVIVLSVILAVLVLPSSYFVLRTSWMNAFFPISLFLFTMVILNKK